MKFQLNRFLRLLLFYKPWKGGEAKGMNRLRIRHPGWIENLRRAIETIDRLREI